MRFALIFIGACITLLAMGPLALSVYTTNKVERMGMVRGEIAGARFVTGTVDRKWIDRAANGDVHWLEVRYGTDRTDVRRENVDAGVWSRLAVGGSISVAMLPDGDAVLPDGIWASVKNLEFDRGLLVAERIVAVLVLALGLGTLGTGVVLTLRQRR
jgi:hypothetical protein